MNAVIDAHRKAIAAEFGLIVELDALGLERTRWRRITAHGIEKEIVDWLAPALVIGGGPGVRLPTTFAFGVSLHRQVAVARLPLGELGIGDGEERLRIGRRHGSGDG